MGIFGGGKPKSKSGNHAWNEIETYFQPTLGYTSSAGNQIASILGVGPPTIGDKIGKYSSGDGTTYGSGGGGGGGNALGGLQNYFNSSGGQFLLNQGLDSLTNKFSAMGLSRSGAAMKGMEQFRQDLVSTKLDNYLGQLNDLARIGLGSGGLMSSAGAYSKGEGQGGGGLGSILGSALGAIAMSDVALKDNVVDLPLSIGGVPAISFTYRDGFGLPKGRFVGVRAQDVAKLRPDALGPTVKGFLSVNYDQLRSAAP